MKVYSNKNVLDAFFERANYILDEFDQIYVSISGGKDSSVLAQMFNMVCEERDRQFDLFFIDLEAGFSYTFAHVEELKKLSMVRDSYHFAIPMAEENGISALAPNWITWDESKRDLWIRDKPKDSITLENCPSMLYREGAEWEHLIKQFPRFIMQKHSSEKVAGLIGLRTDESLHRFKSIAFAKNMYKDKNYSTKHSKGVYSFSPIYDWSVGDIWGAVAKFDLKFNKAYELMYKAGIPVSSQRICQPFGPDQKASLDQFAEIEPDLWPKLLDRVSGVNFGRLYSKTSLLGVNGSCKPSHMNWQEYTVFLLETLGMYEKDLMLHYVRKFNILFEYIKKEEGLDISDIQDEHKAGRHITNKDWLSWKRIAKCLEKNDFECRGLNYGLTNTDRAELFALKEKWGKFLGVQTKTKKMREIAKILNNE